MRNILRKKVHRQKRDQVIVKALDELQKLLEREILPVAQIDVLTKLIESLEKI